MLLMFLACLNGPGQGTAVGNPTGLSVTTASGSDVLFTSGSASVTQVEQGACSQEAILVQPVGREISLIAGNLPLTSGDWCTVSLGFSGPILLEGQGNGYRLHLALELKELVIPVQKPLQGGYVLELGYPGWVDGLAPASGDLIVQPGSPEHDRLLLALGQSRLYRDLNKNSQVDSEDRDSGNASSTSSFVYSSPTPDPADSGAVSEESQRQTWDSAADTGAVDTGHGDDDDTHDDDDTGSGNSAGGNGNGNAYGLDKKGDSDDADD